MNFEEGCKVLQQHFERKQFDGKRIIDYLKEFNLCISRSGVNKKKLTETGPTLPSSNNDDDVVDEDDEEDLNNKINTCREKDSFWYDFKQLPEGQEYFALDQMNDILALNGIDHVRLVQNNLVNCVNNYAAAIVINTSSKLAPNAVSVDFQSLYPTVTILLNIDSSSLAYWSEFKIYIRDLDIYVNPFDEKYIRAEACQIKINNSYINVCSFFIRPEIQKSLTSILQSELAKERADVRSKLKKLDKNNQSEYLFFEANQLAIKRVMNSIYGTTACNFYSSYSLFVSSEITKKARNQLFSLYMYSHWYCWKRNLIGFLNIIYGDTDSLFSNYNLQLLTTDFIKKLAYEYKRYPCLKKIYDQNTETYEVSEFNENKFEKLVRDKFELDNIEKWIYLKILNWKIVGDNKQKIDVQDHLNYVIEQNYDADIEFKTVGDLMTYNGDDKWKKRWIYLTMEIRPFDRSILIYIQYDILHKYSMLPRNRILVDGHSWDDLIFENRENEHELIGALNIDKISERVVIVNLEKQINNLFVFKKKNYIGNAVDGKKLIVFSKGGLIMNSKQPIPIKNFLNKIWEVFGQPSKYLSITSKEKIKEAFEEFFNCPNTYFYINCKIGRKLDEYKNTNITIDQLKKINSLGLENLNEGDIYCKTYYNYFFQGPFIFKKIDKNNDQHLRYLKTKKESNMLIQNLVSQVEQKLTQRDLLEFKKTFCVNKNQITFGNRLEHLARLHYYKLGIKDLELDKETILYKNVVSVMTEFFKTIRSQNSYYLDFESCFETSWLKHFGTRFITPLNRKNIDHGCKRTILGYFK
jgi:hypothetical protein